jgi:toxin ParE1/3/4
VPILRITRSPAARRDLKAIYKYLTKDSASAAIAMVQRIDRDIGFLSRHPYMGEPQPSFGENIRRITVRNYLVFYEVTTRVRIMRILHASQQWEDLL